jgi:hypothetical protein
MSRLNGLGSMRPQMVVRNSYVAAEVGVIVKSKKTSSKSRNYDAKQGNGYLKQRFLLNAY